MIKKIFFYAITILFIKISFSQTEAPIKLIWSKCYGGFDNENVFSAKMTPDSGVIMGGLSESSDGDLHNNNGDFDWWILKIDKNKDTIFSKSYGGTEFDQCRYAIGNSDGKTFMAFGSSHSIEGGDLDSSQIYGNSAFCTFWLLKIDENGKIIFQKAYNGNGVHGGRSMVQTTDGFVLLGWSSSTNNYFTGNHGDLDAYLIKTDTLGNMVWIKNFGGSQREECIPIIQTADKGFVFSGYTQSNDGDFSGLNHGDKDVMMVKTDSLGNTLWIRTYGGIGADQVLGLSLDWDGNILACGEDSIASGDCNNLHGGFDGWILKINQQTGDTIWTLNLGDSDSETALRFLSLPDKGYIALLSTTSKYLDALEASQTLGHGDILLVRLDSARNIIWRKSFGGTWGETANDIQIFNDGYMVWGETASSDGDVVGHHAVNSNDKNRDVWAFFVVDSTLISTSVTTGIFLPSFSEHTFEFEILSSINDGHFSIVLNLFTKLDMEVEIRNSIGEIIQSLEFSYQGTQIKHDVNLMNKKAGIYYVIIKNDREQCTKKMIIMN